MVIAVSESLGVIERRVYRAYWNDGLLDLFAAAGVLAVGVFWIVGIPVGAAITPVLLVPLWGPLRKRLIEPRLGMVEFSDARERRSAVLLRRAMLLGSGFFALGVALYSYRENLPADPPVSLVAGLPAVLLGLLALITTVLVATPRFLAHAAILVVAGAAGALLGVEPGWTLTAAGTAMLAIAVVALARFFRDNPIGNGDPP